MAELDFDELDRAVNSLMSQAPVSVPAKQDDDITTVELSSNGDTPAEPPAPSDPPETPAVEEVPAPIAPEKPEEALTQAASQTVKPRRGRFMDVIHPSATKETEKLAAPSARPSREAKVIEPRSGGLIADIVKKPAQQSSDAPAADEPTETTPEVAEAAPVVASDATLSETPAPLAPAGSDFSAFLPDAKVEKRPLGQSASPAPVAETAAPAEPDTAPAPEEYDQQLMAIESGTTKSTEPEPVSETPPAEVEASEPSAASPETPPEPEPISAPETPVIVPESKPAGPTSIAQQYQEQPSSSDQSNGAIYDTATYHQPLSHPAKKSSGWLWVILIIAIILIGAGAGAYIYLNGV